MLVASGRCWQPLVSHWHTWSCHSCHRNTTAQHQQQLNQNYVQQGRQQQQTQRLNTQGQTAQLQHRWGGRSRKIWLLLHWGMVVLPAPLLLLLRQMAALALPWLSLALLLPLTGPGPLSSACCSGCLTTSRLPLCLVACGRHCWAEGGPFRQTHWKLLGECLACCACISHMIRLMYGGMPAAERIQGSQVTTGVSFLSLQQQQSVTCMQSLRHHVKVSTPRQYSTSGQYGTSGSTAT